MTLRVTYEMSSDGTCYAVMTWILPGGILIEFVGFDEAVPLESAFEPEWVN